jgi:hypothetical protein
MIYVDTDIGKEKFDVCSLDSNGDLISTEQCTNDYRGFEKFLEYVRTITNISNNDTAIYAESPGIYHISFCQYLSEHGYTVKVLNGIETKGLKDSRLRKGKSDDFPHSKDKHDFPYSVLSMEMHKKIIAGLLSTNDHSLGELSHFPTVLAQTAEMCPSMEVMLDDTLYSSRSVCSIVDFYAATSHFFPRRNAGFNAKGVRS